MKDYMGACECGSEEFITQPNAYDVYKLINEKLEFVSQEFVEGETILRCRVCGNEYKTESLFMS